MNVYYEYIEAHGVTYCVTVYDDVQEDEEPTELLVTTDDDPPF